MSLSGAVALPWWMAALVALLLTHFTIVAVTIYLHRHQTHRALDLHPLVSHVFRFWIWLTTGMVTQEWVAVHRKHHAKTETAEDPHSPQVLGIRRLLLGGVFLYVREAEQRDTIARYGHGTPQDWLERHIYSRCPYCGMVMMGIIDGIAFGLTTGSLIFAVQMIWIPFWAAGVVNGVGHYWGYRNYPVEDASTNIFPWGILIGGEEFHNNHHAYPSSAKLSSAWYEFDIGWMYIRLLESLGLARVRRVAPVPSFDPHKTQCDENTVKAIITHRHYVLAQYTFSVRRICTLEIARLRRHEANSSGAGLDALFSRHLLGWLHLRRWDRRARHAIVLDHQLPRDKLLHTAYSMGRELSELWRSSSASTEQLLKQLGDWRERAEASGIGALSDFSRRLPQLV